MRASRANTHQQQHNIVTVAHSVEFQSSFSRCSVEFQSSFSRCSIVSQSNFSQSICTVNFQAVRGPGSCTSRASLPSASLGFEGKQIMFPSTRIMSLISGSQAGSCFTHVNHVLDHAIKHQHAATNASFESIMHSRSLELELDLELDL